MRMAKYLRDYDTLPKGVKEYYPESEFVAELSKDWELQQTFETIGWPEGWPFSSVDKIPYLVQHIKWAKSEGATDEDIYWWWNLSPLDRILIKGTDRGFRRMAFADFCNKGLAPEKTLEKIKKTFSTYAEEEPALLSMTTGDKEYYSSQDRPLPIELHDRVDIYLEDHSGPENLSKMKEESEKFSSFNVFIRKKIEAEPLETDSLNEYNDELSIDDIKF